jgi:hypothetical protein
MHDLQMPGFVETKLDRPEHGTQGLHACMAEIPLDSP